MRAYHRQRLPIAQMRANNKPALVLLQMLCAVKLNMTLSQHPLKLGIFTYISP